MDVVGDLSYLAQVLEVEQFVVLCLLVFEVSDVVVDVVEVWHFLDLKELVISEFLVEWLFLLVLLFSFFVCNVGLLDVIVVWVGYPVSMMVEVGLDS